MDNSSSGLAPTSNQRFLLYFITGLYFGPHLREGPRKSVLQRWGEGLPLYTMDQLAGSCMDIEIVVRVYYHVLKKANKFVILESVELHQFFLGNLPSPRGLGDQTRSYPQFDGLFPPNLHPRVQSQTRCEAVENVVLIHNPDFSCVSPGDIERFRRLTGLEDLCLDGFRGDGLTLYDVPLQDNSNSEDLVHHHSQQSLDIVPYCGASSGGDRQLDIVTFSNPVITTSQMSNGTISLPTNTSSPDSPEPRMIFLPSCPPRKVWNNIVVASGGFALTGTAAIGNVGPVLGLVDIGENKDSYLFRVSLPGVKRNEREFSCEVENDGKVIISGVTTTGEKTVYRYSQAFQMQSQNLCPSGHFSISFHLPGPVDPYNFSGNFGTDGILEGVVMKLA
ncbi:OLC1v1000501C2 [Oldenlandia corymbosa var. corymbosa]|uniref:OLC1v1000501C2 n=1 Tax=Oldenlandia corymbosa var. corymbosa TaxID=529605 RepID=A0AAV1D345_OLDCO|nr:OLC1v1000501C2 [Oldenlandia corymbosa var. corymbosa]